MSQPPEEYRVFLKLHEAFIKMCDVSIKTLEIIEQDKETGSDNVPSLRNQMETLVIENLSLFQDKAFIETTQGDKIVKQGIQEKITVNIGDKAQISGNFVVAKSIESSFNKLEASDINKELKDLLVELSLAVGKIIEHLPEDEGEDVAEDLDSLINQAAHEKPKQKWWSVSIDGLSKAAEKTGEIGAPVLELVSKIVPILSDVSI